MDFRRDRPDQILNRSNGGAGESWRRLAVRRCYWLWCLFWSRSVSRLRPCRSRSGCRMCYQGAPTPVTAYLSVGLESGGLRRAWIRVLQPFMNLPQTERLIFVIALHSRLIYGNLAALPQTNLKRLLASPAIAHAGLSAHRRAFVSDRPRDYASISSLTY